MPEELSLRERQSLFAVLIAQLILWISSSLIDAAVTLGEGAVTKQRKVRVAPGTGKVNATDAVHTARSLHYSRLAQDLNLFVAGKYITDGADPTWTLIGEHWEKMHELCRWGGRFKSGDANHFSLEFEGRA